MDFVSYPAKDSSGTCLTSYLSSQHAQGSDNSWGFACLLTCLIHQNGNMILGILCWNFQGKKKVNSFFLLFFPILFKNLFFVVSLLRWSLDRSSVCVHMCVHGGKNSLITHQWEGMPQDCTGGWSMQCISITSAFLTSPFYLLSFPPQQPLSAFPFHRGTSSLFHDVR